jgi:hypothetical protein
MRGEEESWAKHPDTFTAKDADFKKWTHNNLTSSKDGLIISDLDAVIRKRTKSGLNKIALLEVKRRNSTMPTAQEISLKILSKLLFAGCKALDNKVSIEINGETWTIPVEFTGFHLLQLSADTFANSTYTLDGKNVTATELIDRLNFDAT